MSKKYMIRENDLNEAKRLISQIRHNLSERKLMFVKTNLNRLNDILLNIREVKPHDSDQTTN